MSFSDSKANLVRFDSLTSTDSALANGINGENGLNSPRLIVPPYKVSEINCKCARLFGLIFCYITHHARSSFSILCGTWCFNQFGWLERNLGTTIPVLLARLKDHRGLLKYQVTVECDFVQVWFSGRGNCPILVASVDLEIWYFRCLFLFPDHFYQSFPFTSHLGLSSIPSSTCSFPFFWYALDN